MFVEFIHSFVHALCIYSYILLAHRLACRRFSECIVIALAGELCLSIALFGQNSGFIAVNMCTFLHLLYIILKDDFRLRTDLNCRGQLGLCIHRRMLCGVDFRQSVYSNILHTDSL